MDPSPALTKVVDRLHLDATAPEPTGPQVRRRRGDWDDDDTDDEDAPPRQVPRVGWPEIVAQLDPLSETTAKARFVTEFPDPRAYPAWVPKELVSGDVLPTPYETKWAEWLSAKEKRDAAFPKIAKAETARDSALAKVQEAERDLSAAQEMGVAHQQQRLQATIERKLARARDVLEKKEGDVIVARAGWSRFGDFTEALEAEAKGAAEAEGRDSDAALVYHKHPYELIAKKIRPKREAEANYFVQPAQLPSLSDPRNLGVAVYKIFDTDDERKQWVESMKHAVDNTPEFVEQHYREGGTREGQRRSLFDMTQTNIAAGGFAALNHPSSFHNQFVRSLRMRAHGEVVFRDLFGMTNNNGANRGSTHLEQVVDRMMVRRSQQTPTSEAWHRDVAVGTRPGDRVFGGWINLNSYDQYFSCVLGSAHERRDPTDPVGFATIPEAKHPEIVARSSKVVIPPGHMIVFNEDTIHEVANNTNTTTLLRLFTGWRLSRWEPFGQTPEPLIVDLDRRLRDQEGMPLKSGQHKHYYDDYFEDKVPEARKYHETNNPSGFKYYPGPPPFYPSAYWGQIDPVTVIQFCQLLKPELVHTRFFNPETSQKRSGQFPNGVRCNLDIHHAPSGTQFNANDAQPHKADTIRGLKEIKEWMESHHRNREVAQWMQEDYAPEEVEILKPRAIQALRLMLTSPACVARASPTNRATAANLRNGVAPIARLLQVPMAPPQ